MRVLALLLLACVTVYGVATLFSGDWRNALGYWRGKGMLFLFALLMQWADISVDSMLWVLVQREMGVRVTPRKGYFVFLSGYSGLLLPLQLGRIVRADLVGRLGMGRTSESVKGELAQLYLIFGAAGALLGGVVASRVHWTLAPIGVVAVVLTGLLLADRLFAMLARTPVRMPDGFWRRPAIVAVAFLAMFGWCINGTLLFLMVRDLPGNVQLWQTLIIAPGNAVLGMATGLPGGIGAVEGLLGVSLRLLEVPATQLALAVASFRLVTFWFWVPVGWLCLTLMNRRIAAAPRGPADS